ncbi:MAG: hypothetical protein NZM38_07905 [Cytophagales bacterium]|nr:hypothetical protein [Cytophagales bacterium]MDW8384681.1 hypothetical protein [Flammeovirgaceae bacterium]
MNHSKFTRKQKVYTCKCFEELVYLILDKQATQEQIEEFEKIISQSKECYSFYLVQKKIHYLLRASFHDCPVCPVSLKEEIIQKIEKLSAS